MRRVLLIVIIAVSALFAQVGVARNAHGIRVPSAFTLQQGNFYFVGSFETISDGEPLAIDGYTDLTNGGKTELDDQAASSGGSIQANYGVFDFLELGISLPIYYESKVTATHFEGIAAGDLQGSLKVNVPLGLPIYLSFEGDVYAPTGSKTKGFRPRHAWFIDSDKRSYAYTNGQVALAGSAFLTFSFFDVLYWNNFGGYLTTMGKGTDVLLWGSGFELFPEKMISIIAEISGEMRIKEMTSFSSLWNEPTRFTPGIRIHLPNYTNIVIGADIGLDILRERKIGNGIEVTRQDKDRDIKYVVPATSEIGFNFALTKMLDLSWKDVDRDGVPDRKDMCPGSSFGVIVNSRGCPVDQDQDGVLNIVDDCPDTPLGLEVDFFGCPLDEDKDNVPDYKDKCPATPIGSAVDKDGCIKDSDNDGVDDNNDKCENTSPEEQVNTNGCPIDDDHDGVLNESDKCPDTHQGQSVDRDGCPLDFDKDGIPDDVDKCPNSTPGEHVDIFGCPSDQDKDGVPDTKDQCPDTPFGFSVDMSGCPIDNDHDNIPDDLDKCPNTPENAPVNENGCPKDSDNDGIADYLDKCPETFPDILVDNHGCPYNSKMNLNTLAKQIQFKGSSDQLVNSSYTAFNDLIELLRRYEFNLVIEISANGPNAQEISEARVENISAFLKIKGYEEPRVRIQAVGNAFASGIKFTASDIKR